MKITIKLIFILSITFTIALCSRTNVTSMYAKLLPSGTISYQAHSGYQDIDWYIPPSQASIYYSLWQCSTKRFSDHSTPVIFYLAGGPGLSSQFYAFRQFGPIEIIKKNGEFVATQNPWSWNYYAHLVFVDVPAGVGFSFNRGKSVDTSKGAGSHFVNFLYNFLKNTPFGLNTNPIYLAGSDYAGQYISSAFQFINNNRSLGLQIQGIIIGGSIIHPEKQINHYQSYLQSAGIVTPKQRDVTHYWTNQAILKIRNSQFSQVNQFLQQIWTLDASNKFYNGMDVNNYKRYTLDTEGSDYVGFLNQRKNDLGVPDDVNFVQFNAVVRSSMSTDMFKSYSSSFELLVKSGKRILIYNGQNDFFANPAGMLTYLQDIQWPFARQWKQSKKQIWKESGNISGWVKKYKNLIYVIVKGAGHYVYEDQTTSDRSMFLMINNYFNRKW